MTTEFAKVQNYFSIARCPHGAVNLIKKLRGARAAQPRAAMYAARLTSLKTGFAYQRILSRVIPSLRIELLRN